MRSAFSLKQSISPALNLRQGQEAQMMKHPPSVATMGSLKSIRMQIYTAPPNPSMSSLSSKALAASRPMPELLSLRMFQPGETVIVPPSRCKVQKTSGSSSM